MQRSATRYSLLLYFIVAATAAFAGQIEPQTPKQRSSAITKECSPVSDSQWGEAGTGDGQFHSPVGIAISKDDVVYVTDLNNARVQKFDTNGKHLGGFKLPRDSKDRNTSLAGGIAVGNDGLLYVSFMNQHRIRVYTDSGKLVREWGTKGSEPGELNGPGGLVINGKTIAVADQRNHRVQVFTAGGRFVKTWGRHGSETGAFGGHEKAGSRFGGPNFIASDSRGRFFTTEGTQARVQRFAADGTAGISWGSDTDKPGGFGALDAGLSKNKFGPVAIMVDRHDRVWVSSLNDRVQAFTTDGKYLFGIGSTGDGPGEFSYPHGMAVDSNGDLYVADAGNQRIQKFKLPGITTPPR